MKWLFAIVGVALAGGFGYVMEPAFRPSLTGKPNAAPRAPSAPERVVIETPAPTRPPVAPPTDETAPAESEDPAPVVEPAIEPEPRPVVEPEPQPEPEPEPVVEPEPDPEPEPAEEPAGPLDVVAIMQASIQEREIREFEFSQVTKWTAGEDETVDGETFRVGTVEYRAQTIFGARDIVAKAYIRDNRVVRWIFPNTGMEIR